MSEPNSIRPSKAWPFSRHSRSFFLCEMSRMMSSFKSGGADSVSMSE
jgi:hypothetical protein